MKEFCGKRVGFQFTHTQIYTIYSILHLRQDQWLKEFEVGTGI